jgi:hypothetical protein
MVFYWLWTDVLNLMKTFYGFFVFFTQILD